MFIPIQNVVPHQMTKNTTTNTLASILLCLTIAFPPGPGTEIEFSMAEARITGLTLVRVFSCFEATKLVPQYKQKLALFLAEAPQFGHLIVCIIILQTHVTTKLCKSATTNAQLTQIDKQCFYLTSFAHTIYNRWARITICFGRITEKKKLL